jgi:hypothetical protein
MRFLIFFIAILACSCKSDNLNTISQANSMFTYDIQYGGEPHQKYDLKGQTNYSNFISAFESFPWLDEIDKANANPEGSSPTLSVKNKSDERDFWVSMSGDRTNHGYLVGYVFPKTKKGLFGFGKEKTVKWLEIYLIEDQQQVKDFFQLYFDKKYEQLHSQLSHLEKFGEMEAQNQ